MVIYNSISDAVALSPASPPVGGCRDEGSKLLRRWADGISTERDAQGTLEDVLQLHDKDDDGNPRPLLLHTLPPAFLKTQLHTSLAVAHVCKDLKNALLMRDMTRGLVLYSAFLEGHGLMTSATDHNPTGAGLRALGRSAGNAKPLSIYVHLPDAMISSAPDTEAQAPSVAQWPYGARRMKVDAGWVFELFVHARTPGERLLLAHYAYLRQVPPAFDHNTGDMPGNPAQNLPVHISPFTSLLLVRGSPGDWQGCYNSMDPVAQSYVDMAASQYWGIGLKKDGDGDGSGQGAQRFGYTNRMTVALSAAPLLAALDARESFDWLRVDFPQLVSMCALIIQVSDFWMLFVTEVWKAKHFPRDENPLQEVSAQEMRLLIIGVWQRSGYTRAATLPEVGGIVVKAFVKFIADEELTNQRWVVPVVLGMSMEAALTEALGYAVLLTLLATRASAVFESWKDHSPPLVTALAELGPDFYYIAAAVSTLYPGTKPRSDFMKGRLKGPLSLRGMRQLGQDLVKHVFSSEDGRQAADSRFQGNFSVPDHFYVDNGFWDLQPSVAPEDGQCAPRKSPPRTTPKRRRGHSNCQSDTPQSVTRAPHVAVPARGSTAPAAGTTPVPLALPQERPARPPGRRPSSRSGVTAKHRGDITSSGDPSEVIDLAAGQPEHVLGGLGKRIKAGPRFEAIKADLLTPQAHRVMRELASAARGAPVTTAEALRTFCLDDVVPDTLDTADASEIGHAPQAPEVPSCTDPK